MPEEFKRTAQEELSEMEEHIAKLQNIVEENRSKINKLINSSEADFEEQKGVWSKAVEDWRAMLRFFSKS
ncbi:MAG: hypothetical protein JXK94_00495 [Deltaproteobacteria bacterium]|nr:hypothetical protein [Deltaproteobacteria bacterium]